MKGSASQKVVAIAQYASKQHSFFYRKAYLLYFLGSFLLTSTHQTLLHSCTGSGGPRNNNSSASYCTPSQYTGFLQSRIFRTSNVVLIFLIAHFNSRGGGINKHKHTPTNHDKHIISSVNRLQQFNSKSKQR